MSVEERIVEAMGTTAHLIVNGGRQEIVERALAHLHELETRWSRFRPDSEVSRLNELPGVPVLVSAETFLLVERAVEGWRATGGLFDPTMLRELRDAGYDRTFELLGAGAASTRSVLGGSDGREHPPRPGAAAIHLDPVVGTVRIDAGIELDPGGIGKGLAADLLVEELLEGGAAGALVSIGGDLRAEGTAPEESGWVVAIADPSIPERVIASFALDAGAVASTWRTKRCWTAADGTTRHHVIDPRTSVSAATGFAGVTVIAGRGWQAEVLAKAAFLAGRRDAEPMLRAQHAAALAVGDDGTICEFGELAPYLCAGLEER